MSDGDPFERLAVRAYRKCGHVRHGLLMLDCGHVLRWPDEGPEPPYNGDPPPVGWAVFCWPRCADFRRVTEVVA